jgi:hypothetical protein
MLLFEQEQPPKNEWRLTQCHFIVVQKNGAQYQGGSFFLINVRSNFTACVVLSLRSTALTHTFKASSKPFKFGVSTGYRTPVVYDV